MKRYLSVTVAAVALGVPSAALAADQPSANSLAIQSCKAKQAGMGAALFKQTFGANAYGKCVSLAVRSANANLQNSAEACNAEQADASFAASHQGKTFDAFYGANGKGKGSASNAFGKCVSGKAQAKTQQQTQAAVAAAKSCKAALLASKAAFATAWGTGSNAFGKCVSTKAKA